MRPDSFGEPAVGRSVLISMGARTAEVHRTSLSSRMSFGCIVSLVATNLHTSPAILPVSLKSTLSRLYPTGVCCLFVASTLNRIPWDVETSFAQDNGLGGAPGDLYCVLACEQWNSPLYCDSEHPQVCHCWLAEL